MRVSRFYYPYRLASGTTQTIQGDYRHRLANVLRLKRGDELILFNGQAPVDYVSRISKIDKKNIVVEILEEKTKTTESALDLILWQAVSRSDRMDFAIQKAVELGVKLIQPMTTERSPFNLKGEKLAKKMNHWMYIITHACEQSGRSILPELNRPEALGVLLSKDENNKVPTRNKWLLSPSANKALGQAGKPLSEFPIIVCIGSEGGFTADEEQACTTAGFQSLSAGPRILRTETAATAILTWAQITYGDMGC